ncbi:MAG: DUF1003 domain-containing protein [Polyangiaceae bacterium]
MTPTFECPTCGKHRPVPLRVPGSRLRTALRERMQQDHPDWDGQVTCHPDVQHYRTLLLEEALEEQRGTVSALDAVVLERMTQSETLSKNLEAIPPTRGERVADRVATFGGSWTFLGTFGAILVVWMVTNALLAARAFDPYPFILLNLVLSCLAAIQAPVIMMSQNRQADKDRERAEHDYQVNLKAELEVQLLHEKLDHLLFTEWHKLLEIQAIQTEMLEELAGQADKKAR